MDVLRHTVMITGFVFVMMLVIEYVNVLTRGVWQSSLARSRFGQYIIAALLGAIPGCLGAFAVVAMFSHRVIGFGAVVTAMIATSGDEAFVMLAMIPKQAFILSGILLLVGIIAGILTDLIMRRVSDSKERCCEGLVLHEEHKEDFHLKGKFVAQWRHCTAARGILAIVLAGLMIGIITGQIGHHGHGHPGDAVGVIDYVEHDDHQEHNIHRPMQDDRHEDKGHESGGWGWVRITMLFSSAIALFVVATVPDHFLEEHLWEHIAKKHLIHIFLWTFGVLVFLYILTNQLNLDLESLAVGGKWILLGVACVIGLIPQSGPHLVFVTLFAQGLVPFSVLLASSIVQDGHGMLPMLAHSRKMFFVVKAINLLAGFLVGAAAFMAGF